MTTLMPRSSLYLPIMQTYMFSHSIDAADDYRQRSLASRMGLQSSRIQTHHPSRWHSAAIAPPCASLRKRQSEPAHMNLRRPTARRRTAQTSRPLGPIVTSQYDAILAVPAFFHADPQRSAIPAMSPHDGADARAAATFSKQRQCARQHAAQTRQATTGSDLRSAWIS